ncbi:MAG: glycosyltransferase family 2 protein [Chloroflexi bacterium]|nr:glycosyltransferase family 2 protein [Chloroflexota bacterium]
MVAGADDPYYGAGPGDGRVSHPTITAAILARDEAAVIEGCIASVRWADDVLVVVDDATTDATAQQAMRAGARVVSRPFQGFPHQRNAALALARGDWVLFVDADERVPPSLAGEVRWAVERADETAGFWIPRRNVIAGGWVRYAGWWPDCQLRLLRRGHARYDERAIVHEVATLDGPSGTLAEPFLHLNYDSLGEFRAKQARYAVLEADALWERGVRARPRNLLLQPLREFRRRTWELSGYRQGVLGMRLGVEMARASFLTYRALLTRTRESTVDGARS